MFLLVVIVIYVVFVVKIVIRPRSHMHCNALLFFPKISYYLDPPHLLGPNTAHTTDPVTQTQLSLVLAVVVCQAFGYATEAREGVN